MDVRRALLPIRLGVDRAPSIYTVLEEQLGLKIEKTRGPQEFLVIDSVESPSSYSWRSVSDGSIAAMRLN